MGNKDCLLTGDGFPKDLDHRRHAREEEGRMTQTLLHSYDQGRMLYGLSVFNRI